MTTILANHIINQPQTNLHNNKNKMEQSTPHFPKNTERAKKSIPNLNNTQLKGLVELIAT